MKLVLLFKRKNGMSVEAFMEHWRTVHIPLVLAVPGIQRYTITPFDSSPEHGDPPYDGMAELYFDSRADLDAALESEATAETARDARNFIERGSILRLISKGEQQIA